MFGGVHNVTVVDADIERAATSTTPAAEDLLSCGRPAGGSPGVGVRSDLPLPVVCAGLTSASDKRLDLPCERIK